MSLPDATPPADLDALAAVVRGLPHDAVVSGMTAARVHGLWVPNSPRVEPVELTVPGRSAPPRHRPHSRLPEVRHRRRQLLPDEVTVLDGVPITTAARTWVDLAEVLVPADLVAAGDSLLRGGVGLTEVDELIRRARHRRGVLRARHVLGHLDPRSRSRPESWMRYGLVSFGLPKPDVNEPVVVDGEWVGEPDLSYKRARLALEYQGAVHAEERRMRKDITRQLSFAEVDWLVMYAGPSEVFTFPDRFLRRVAFELGRRGGA